MKVRSFALIFGVGALGALVRLYYVSRGGFLNVRSYDDGVYYAAAASFLHGLMPYRDFLLVHPPGIVLAGVPFALIGQLLGDPTALIAARIFFPLVGGLNAALIAAILIRFGRGAALTGGVAYALSFPAVYAERSLLLEPLATTMVLLSLLALGKAAEKKSLYWVAGVFAGLALTFKVWYLIPALVIVAFAARNFWRVGLGTVVSSSAIIMPFFLPAPGQMWRDVVAAQVGRDATEYHLGERLYRMYGILGYQKYALPGLDRHVLLTSALLVTALLLLTCLSQKRAWIFAALFIVSAIAVLRSPSFFQHYTALTAPPMALLIGVGVGWAVRRIGTLPRQTLRVILSSAAILGVLFSSALLNQRSDRAATGAELPRKIAQAMMKYDGCVASDNPTLLIAGGTLSPSLNRGCKVVVDVTGQFLVIEGPRSQKRVDDVRYQRELLTYYRGADAFIFAPGRGAGGLTDENFAALAKLPAIYEAKGYALRSTD